MSSLSDVMSAAIAMMMSAAFVHFGVTGGSTPHKDTAPPPAAHSSTSASAVSDAPPVPGDDDRFDNSASAASVMHVAKPHHSLS